MDRLRNDFSGKITTLSFMYNTKLLFALTIYISALFASNLLGLKTFPFLFGTHLSFAVFTLPFVFITTDVIGKVYGKEFAKKFVFLGFSALIFWTIFSLFSMYLPWASQSYGRIGVAYETIFTLSIRIVFASLVAFLISEYLDVVVFFRFKNQKKSFWLASFFSNLVSQFLDTILFMCIAFLGFYDIEKILMMGIPYWLYKVSM
jgi:uncharacterized integral membrane protein (TIGR00697 family)